ncbi:nuclear transport factor 2 family protein [Ekhidna sp.]
MKHLPIITLFLFAWGCTSGVKQNIVDANDLEVLTDIQKTQWVKAYLEQDTVLLDKLLHEHFQLIDDNGDRYTKQDELSYVGKYGPSYNSLEFQILEVDIVEIGSAVVLAKGTMKGLEGDEAYITTYTSSTSFVKIDKQWKALNSHVSGVKEERFPMAPSD